MSAGLTLLDSRQYLYHHPPHHHHPSSASMAPPGSNGSRSAGAAAAGYSDDDLLASLASFGVEGQTERDLATIKAMFAASSAAAAGHSSDSTRFNQGGYTGAWAIPSQQQYHYQHQQQQPPPNTPTFSKSLELQGGNFDNNGYYPNGPYFDLSNGQYSSNNKRRDVSLDRDYLRSLSAGGGGGETSNSMDMDESSEDPMNGSHHNNQQQQEYTIPTSRNGRQRPNLSHNRNPSIDQMEGIPEDEGQLQSQQQQEQILQQQQQQSSMAFACTSPPSRTSGKMGSVGSPASSGGNGQRIEPPMTRSRTRQQHQHQQY